MKKQILYWLCVIAPIAGCSCSVSDGTPVVEPEKPSVVNPSGSQYVANWNMEEDVELTKSQQAVPGKWSYLGGWNESKASVSQESLRGVNGSRCVAIIAEQEDVDVMFGQKITGLDPAKPYRATARVKTEGVGAGKGGHICLDYLWAPASEGVTGTKDWTSVTLDIDEVPADGSVTLCLRLGSTANASRGVAYFDNVSLKENTDLYIRESEHVRLMVDKKYVSISDARIDAWLGNLDKVYEAYVELFSGRKPFEGKVITLRSAVIGAWAYAGNPVQWNQDYISSALLTVGKGDWCFGIMHELGHDFAPYMANATYAFNWNEELFANFRMYYALEKLNATVITDANILQSDGSTKTETKTYLGGDLKQLYKSETTNCYDRTIGANKAVEMGNALCYKLIQIKEKYGWELYVKAFDDLYRVPRNETAEKTMTQWDKFDYFMSFLTKHAGEDIYANNFTSAELETIRAYLQTQK
ncbi:hypothetical protein [Alistipes senegalensis]|uniref:hypothetical protein n=1 Tax=Alistipes senegalensis TaxID=1288121 RepID=UPI0018AB0B48|nr:hypothetical protein [Alistipes senegalensis]